MNKILICGEHKDEEEKINNPRTELTDNEVIPFYEAWGLPLILPAAPFSQEEIDEIIQWIDKIVLIGGLDVDPQLYNEEVKYSNVKMYLFRDQNEIRVVKAAMKYKKPLFGMCRWIQLINVALGGTLYQNISEQVPNAWLHMQSDLYKLSHNIDIKPWFLYDIYKEHTIRVNSRHNQSIKTLGEWLQVAATSSSDNIIEAIYHESLPIFWIQRHPELSYRFDENSKKLIEWFVKL